MTVANMLQRTLRVRGNPSPEEYFEQGDTARLNALRRTPQEIACYSGHMHHSYFAF